MKKCNVCGKQFDEYDYQENFGIHTSVGYGSKYDCTYIGCNICCNCFDKLYDQLKTICVIPPMEVQTAFTGDIDISELSPSEQDGLFN